MVECALGGDLSISIVEYMNCCTFPWFKRQSGQHAVNLHDDILVPYNPGVLFKYNSHLNVAISASAKLSMAFMSVHTATTHCICLPP